MRSVDVSIGHDDDLVIAQLVGIEFVLADGGSERGDERSDFLARQHLVKARTLDVQDFTAEWQNGLIFARTPLLGRATG